MNDRKLEETERLAEAQREIDESGKKKISEKQAQKLAMIDEKAKIREEKLAQLKSYEQQQVMLKFQKEL